MNRPLLVAAALCCTVFLASVGEARKIKREPPPATPAPPERVTSVEGITEYRLANGLRVLLFPDPSKPTVTVNITYLVGSATRTTARPAWPTCSSTCCSRARRSIPTIPTELNERRRAPQRHHLVGSHQLLRDFPRQRGKPALGARPASRTAWSIPSSPRELASEMTVVRNEFEMGENDPVGVLFKRVLSVAYLWHNYGNTHHRRAIGHRERADRAPAGLLPQLLSARQRHAAGRRQASTSRPR